MLEKKIKSAVRMHAYFHAEKSPKSIYSNDFVPLPQGWSHSIVSKPSAEEGGEDLLALFLMRALKNVLHWTRLPGTLVHSTLGENRAEQLTPIPTPSLGFTKGTVRMRMKSSFSHLPVLKIKKNKTNETGVSKPSQSPSWPFIAGFIASVFHEMLLKVVYFKYSKIKMLINSFSIGTTTLMPIKVP